MFFFCFFSVFVLSNFINYFIKVKIKINYFIKNCIPDWLGPLLAQSLLIYNYRPHLENNIRLFNKITKRQNFNTSCQIIHNYDLSHPYITYQIHLDFELLTTL